MRLAATIALVLGVSATAVPAPAGYEFTIQIALTPRAAAKLASLGEGITVAAMYSGSPKPAYRRQADEEGRLYLGDERITAPGRAGPVRITGSKVLRNRLGWVRGPVVVLINVYSARLKGPNNILDCGIYEGPVAAIAASDSTIRCDLIGA